MIIWGGQVRLTEIPLNAKRHLECSFNLSRPTLSSITRRLLTRGLRDSRFRVSRLASRGDTDGMSRVTKDNKYSYLEDIKYYGC